MEDPATLLALAERALQHLQQGTTDSAAAPMHMPLLAYQDPERYAAERERLFKRLPLALALSLELPEVGDYKALTVIETPVLISRGDDGRVRAFLNVCRHRGAQVCADGCASARVFSCPYHAWVYDRQGALVGRYGEDTFGDVDEASLGLRELPCAERAGLIWVMLTPSAEPSTPAMDIDAWLGEFAAQLATLELDSWHLYEQRSLPGPGWKITMDGYLEAYHHALVHKDTVGQHTVGNLLVLDTFGPHQRLTFGRKSLSTLATQDKSQWQPGEHIRLIHSGFPNLSISGILGGFCLVSQIYPGPTPDTTTTVQSILTANEPATAAEKKAAQDFSAMVLKAVQTEDYGIGFSIQGGMQSGANQAFIFGRNEPAVQNYHRTIERLMNQDHNEL